MERLHPSVSQTVISGRTFQEYRRRFDKVIGHEVIDTSIVDHIVFLPGIGRDSTCFTDHIEVLREKGIVSSGINYPDSGNASYFEAQYEMTRTFLDNLRQKGRIGIVGQSRGALHALRYLSEEPCTDDISFAIINSAPIGDKSEVGTPLIHLIHLMESVNDWTYRTTLRAAQRVHDSQNLQLLLEGDRFVLADTYRHAITKDWSHTVMRINSQIPVVYRYGGEDTMVRLAGNSAHLHHHNATVLLDPVGNHDFASPEDMHDMIAYLVNQKKARMMVPYAST